MACPLKKGPNSVAPRPTPYISGRVPFCDGMRAPAGQSAVAGGVGSSICSAGGDVPVGCGGAEPVTTAPDQQNTA